MHKVLHPRDDIDRLYLSRKEGGEDSTDSSIQRLEDYIEKPRKKTNYSHLKQYW